MNLKHFLSKMPLKPPWPPQLPESSPESSHRASESLPDASQMPPRCLREQRKYCLDSRARVILRRIYVSCMFRPDEWDFTRRLQFKPGARSGFIWTAYPSGMDQLLQAVYIMVRASLGSFASRHMIFGKALGQGQIVM